MKRGIPDYFILEKYGILPDDIVTLFLHCKPENIQERVIITPIWSEGNFISPADKFETVVDKYLYDITCHGQKISLIRSGMGAPITGDVILALGCTPCKQIVFTGSFGGLTEKISIGDMVIVTESISGDGFSRYLPPGELSPHNLFQPAKPDAELTGLLERKAMKYNVPQQVDLHKGRMFSADSIVCEYHHLETITQKYDCLGIEMETAAVFNAASLVNISAAAILMASDIIPVKKTLFSGRTQQEKEHYHNNRESVLSKIILETLCDSR
jgi:purine-nucleoside phosphorylase